MMSDRPTVLLIEDSITDRTIYRRFLLRDSQSHYIVLEATSGTEAIALCQQVLPDLIVLDYDLPDMNGLEFLDILEQQFGMSATPVIILTGQGDERLAVQVIKRGVQDYLVKGTLTSESFCAIARTTIQQFRLQQQLKWQQQQQQLISAIALRIRQSLNLQTILDTSVEEVCQALNADRVVVYQFDPETRVRVVAESVLPTLPSCLGNQFDQPCHQEPLFADLIHGKAISIADIDQVNLTPACLSLLKPFQVKALLAVPIWVDHDDLQGTRLATEAIAQPLHAAPNPHHLWGLLLVHQCQTSRQWQQSESDLLKLVAVQMAIAIQQAELHHSLQSLNTSLEHQIQERTTALQISQAKLSDILDHAIACIVSYRLYRPFQQMDLSEGYTEMDWQYEYCSAGSEHVFGLTPTELMSDTLLWYRQIPQDDWQNILLPRYQAIFAQEPITVEYRFRHSNGTVHWISESLTSRWDAATDSWVVTVVSTNISDRKQIEAERNQVEATRKLRENQLWLQQSAMIELSQSHAIYSGKLAAAMQQITQVAAHTLQVERVSIWFYSRDRQQIDCVDLYEASPQRHTHPMTLALNDYPTYFQALDIDQIIAARDAHHDPRTREFSASYLTPLNIQAMLDIPIRSGGQTVGVLCFEHIGATRDWLLEEQNFGTYLAHLVSLALEARDRKQAESESRYTQQFLDSIIEYLPNMVFVKDAQDLRFIRLNRAGEDLLGYSRHELLGKNDHDFFPKEEADFFTSKDREVLQNGELVDIPEEPIQTRYNGIRLLHTKKIPLLDPDGNPQYLMGISEDITEYKKSQEALRQSEERWQLAIQGNNDGIWDWNIVMGEAFRSPRWYEILGYANNDLSISNEEWVSRLHPQDVEKVLATDQAYLNRQIPAYTIEYRIRCKDGSYKWIQSRGQAQWDETGRPVRMVGSFRDVSELKLAEEALRHSERRYATLTEISPVGIFRTDIEGECVYVNPTWCQMAGLNPAAAAGHGWRVAIHPDDRDRITTAWEQASKAQQPFVAEFRFLRPDRLITWVVAQAVAELDINGNIVGYVGTVTNISDRKQAELALQHAKEAAEVANHAKSEFIARMSHELRTPLNAILGFAQVMQGDPSLSNDYQDYVNSIYDSGEHLLKLINNILAIARMDTKSSSADEKEIDLHHVLETIRQSFTDRIQAKKLKLNLDYAPNIPRYIRTNERNLRQILMNLLDNAIQFTDRGQIMLRVASYLPCPEDAPEFLTDSIQRISSILYFEIEDTGAGIAPDEIEQVFKAFMQAKLGRKSGKGLGLGLAISQQLVRGMDGELSVESTVGKGTIFRFHIKVGTLSQSHLAHLSNTSHLINAHLPITAIATTPIHPSTSIRLSEEEMIKMLSAIMPNAWVYELHHAAIRGLDQEIVQLIEQIPQDCTYCAELLKDWAEHFLFNKIIELTQKISSTWGQGS